MTDRSHQLGVVNSRAYRQRQLLLDPTFTRNANLRTRYKITYREWLAMLRRQRNRCAVCRRPWSGEPCDFATDHDPKTGRVRGLLCNPCNTSLKRHLTPRLLRKMADYLEAANRIHCRPARSHKACES